MRKLELSERLDLKYMLDKGTWSTGDSQAIRYTHNTLGQHIPAGQRTVSKLHKMLDDQKIPTHATTEIFFNLDLNVFSFRVNQNHLPVSNSNSGQLVVTQLCISGTLYRIEMHGGLAFKVTPAEGSDNTGIDMALNPGDICTHLADQWTVYYTPSEKETIGLDA